MKSNKDIAIKKIIKYLNNEMTKEELQGFELWLSNKENYDLFKEYVVANHYIDIGKNTFKPNNSFDSFLEKIKKKDKKFNLQFFKYAALLAGLFFLISYFIKGNKESKSVVENEVTLELYDGSIQGVGESSEDGVIKDQHGKIVGRQKNDKIIYSVTAADTEVASIKINTIRVPNGKKFQLFLSDGTEIYINSGSVIKFPSAIIPGKLRQVELEGEAFFKVAKNREDAFVVRTKGISTEVFGTQFNVSSYGGDSFAKVVLLEGSVGVFSGKDRFNEKEDHYLKPNQMAVYQNDIEGIDVREVNAEDYIAWVDGALLFKNESFENIMKKLERHYNIEIDVAYEDIKNEKFTGYFDIESIENVLNTFKENTPFSFQLNDNKLTINP